MCLDNEPVQPFHFECELNPPLDWPLPPAEKLEGEKFDPSLPLGRLEKAKVRETGGEVFVELFLRDIRCSSTSARVASWNKGI